jgi:transcriptional regulator with XRE-family HTH domain
MSFVSQEEQRRRLREASKRLSDKHKFLGDCLRIIRHSQGIDLDHLPKKIDLTANQIRSIEDGNIDDSNINEVNQYVAVLGVLNERDAAIKAMSVINTGMASELSTSVFDSMPALGEMIRKVRESHGITQQTLAEKAGLSRAAIVEAEKNSNTGVETLNKIAVALGGTQSNANPLASLMSMYLNTQAVSKERGKTH